MKNSFQKISLGWKALRELGLEQLSLYGRYRFLLRSGWLERATPPGRMEDAGELIPLLPELPDRNMLRSLLGVQGLERTKETADEILAGKVRLFGGSLYDLSWQTQGKPAHWTAYESGKVRLSSPADIKFVWEIGRFGWALSLARAYHLLGDEKYVQGFLDLMRSFFRENPVNCGPQWVSAQEVAIRLIVLVFTAQIFSESALFTDDERKIIARLVAAHARRIVPSIVYARSQNNNHLITEALGLYTAGRAVPGHPCSKRWIKLGLKWLNTAFEKQIDDSGVYIQQSVNYQRVVLQAALWAKAIQDRSADGFSELAGKNLAQAVRWMLSLTDRESGRLPNLGHNDGAYLFPLTNCAFRDYRPTLQAAARVFLSQTVFPPGCWDEMSAWLADTSKNLSDESNEATAFDLGYINPAVLRNPANGSWGYLRVADFQGRPGHADLLHFDLWWQGMNLALDAGTYLYNGDPPWNNSLMAADIHNTVTMDGKDQMTRAGRFLYVDKAHAWLTSRTQAPDATPKRLSAVHDAYRKYGVNCSRSVAMFQEGEWAWEIQDELSTRKEAQASGKHSVRLHWLVPDWRWKIISREAQSITIVLASPKGIVRLMVSANHALDLQIIRGGEVAAGDGNHSSPTWGWFSGTYGEKEPALSLGFLVKSVLPVRFTSRWAFPKVPADNFVIKES